MDAAIAHGEAVGPLAGVPIAVKVRRITALPRSAKVLCQLENPAIAAAPDCLQLERHRPAIVLRYFRDNRHSPMP